MIRIFGNNALTSRSYQISFRIPNILIHNHTLPPTNPHEPLPGNGPATCTGFRLFLFLVLDWAVLSLSWRVSTSIGRTGSRAFLRQTTSPIALSTPLSAHGKYQERVARRLVLERKKAQTHRIRSPVFELLLLLVVLLALAFSFPRLRPHPRKQHSPSPLSIQKKPRHTLYCVYCILSSAQQVTSILRHEFLIFTTQTLSHRPAPLFCINTQVPRARRVSKRIIKGGKRGGKVGERGL